MNFIHAAFLAAGLAIAIPWLLHLTKKRKFLRIRLGSLQFLDPLVRDRHRMSRVEQWPLLIARCLAVILLAMLFSRPFFPKPAPAPPMGGETLILLDASGSITPKQADVIRKQAAETIGSLPKSTRPVIAAISDQVEILPTLEAYQPIPGAPGVFSRAVDWVVDRASAAPDATAGVHWFTDLQRASLPAAPSRLWPSGLSVTVHPALSSADRNVTVEQVELLTPFGGDHWEVEARVRVHGVPGGSALDLTLTTADGKTITATTPPDGGIARFSWQGDAPAGVLSGEVAVSRADDPWPADDMRPFAFATAQPERVHLVDGDPGGSPFLSESYFLEKALHASAAGKSLSPFRATVSPFLPKESDRPDVIALCNVKGLSAANLRQLKPHLERGAGLLVFLGDQTVPTAWSELAAEGWFPSGLRALTETSLGFLRRIDVGHPGLGGLTRESAMGLQLVALSRRFTWPADEQWVTTMAFDESTPFAAFSINKRVAVIAHPANRQGSDLPLNPAFVPFVQGLFSYLTRPVGNAAAVAIESAVPGRDERGKPGIHRENGHVRMISADVGEAEISAAGEKHFRQVLGLPALDAPPPEPVELAADLSSTHLREGEIWPGIVAILMVLLAIESVLAARRIRSSPTPAAHVP